MIVVVVVVTVMSLLDMLWIRTEEWHCRHRVVNEWVLLHDYFCGCGRGTLREMVTACICFTFFPFRTSSEKVHLSGNFERQKLARGDSTKLFSWPCP